jgi:hypothetical protein
VVPSVCALSSKLFGGNLVGADEVGSVHDMRFVFLDNDTKMLFATTYDGEWDTYIDDFVTKIPDLLDIIDSAWEGWPGIQRREIGQRPALGVKSRRGLTVRSGSRDPDHTPFGVDLMVAWQLSQRDKVASDGIRVTDVVEAVPRPDNAQAGRLADERDQLVKGVGFVEARESVGVVSSPVPLRPHPPIMSVAGFSA